MDFLPVFSAHVTHILLILFVFCLFYYFPSGNCFGDPHLITLTGVSYDFHKVGEYVLGHATANGYSLTVVGRMEIYPMDNKLNFTSITRVGITLCKCAVVLMLEFPTPFPLPSLFPSLQ